VQFVGVHGSVVYSFIWGVCDFVAFFPNNIFVFFTLAMEVQEDIMEVQEKCLKKNKE